MNIRRVWRECYAQDGHILYKLPLIVGLTFSLLLVPFGIGVLSLALLWGYQLDLTRNVRDGQPTPLPEWGEFRRRFAVGAWMLLAAAMYSLPTLIWWGVSLIGGWFVTGLNNAVFWCLFPFVLVYQMFAWSLFALGTLRYLDSGDARDYFELRLLLDTWRRNRTRALEWLFASVVLTGGLLLIGAIPVVGWLFFAATLTPLHGHLLGQLATRLNKPVGTPAPAPRKRR
jgi:hypothetical protein